MVASEVEEVIKSVLAENKYKVIVKDIWEKSLTSGTMGFRLIYGIKEDSVVIARLGMNSIRLTIILRNSLSSEKASRLEEDGWKIDVRDEETVLSLRINNVQTEARYIWELLVKSLG